MDQVDSAFIFAVLQLLTTADKKIPASPLSIIMPSTAPSTPGLPLQYYAPCAMFALEHGGLCVLGGVLGASAPAHTSSHVLQLFLEKYDLSDS